MQGGEGRWEAQEKPEAGKVFSFFSGLADLDAV
jgi:hypothetical protein